MTIKCAFRFAGMSSSGSSLVHTCSSRPTSRRLWGGTCCHVLVSQLNFGFVCQESSLMDDGNGL